MSEILPLFDQPKPAAAAPKPRLGDEVAVDGCTWTLWSPGPLAKTWWALNGTEHAVVSLTAEGEWQTVEFDSDLAHRIDQGTRISHVGAYYSMSPTAEVHARGCDHDIDPTTCAPITAAERNAFAQGRPVARKMTPLDRRRTRLDLADCLTLAPAAAVAA